MSQELFWYLGSLVIRSLAIATLAGLCIWRMRNTAVCHAIWTAVLGSMLLMPLIDMSLPPSLLPASILGMGSSLLPEANGLVRAVALPAAPPLESGRALSTPYDWWQLGALLYGLVTVTLTLQLGLSYRRLWIFARAGRPLNMPALRAVASAYGYQGPMPSVCESDSIPVPVTIGFTRPLVILPAEWRLWDKVTLDAVLAHELAHVRRRDWMIAALAALNTCLFWFSPLSWWLKRHLAELCEKAADEESLLYMRDPAQYAEILLRFATAHRGRRVLTGGVAMARHQVRSRIERILTIRRPRTGVLGASAWVAVLAFTLPALFAAAALHVAMTAEASAAEPPRVAENEFVPSARVVQTPNQSTVRRIEDVQVQGNRRISTERIRINLQTKPGIAFDPELINRDVQALMALGFFDDVRVNAETGPNGGTILMFSVQERPMLRAVEYRGIKSLKTSEILERYRLENVGFMADGYYRSETANAAAATLKSMLAEKGHPEASIEIVTEPVPPNAVRLIFTIDEGPIR